MPAEIYQHVEKRHRKHAAPCNSNWSSGPAAAIPFQLQERRGPTAFEELVAELGVPEMCWHQDPRIAHWVHKHKNFRYVPESLLKTLGERVIDDGDAL